METCVSTKEIDAVLTDQAICIWIGRKNDDWETCWYNNIYAVDYVRYYSIWIIFISKYAYQNDTKIQIHPWVEWSLTLGYKKYISCTLSSAVIKKNMKKINMLLYQCYPYLCTISDGNKVSSDAKIFNFQ